MTLVLVTAYHSFGGEVEASNTPTIRRLTPSCRHQLPRIAHWAIELDTFLASNFANRSKIISRAFDRTFLYASRNRADSAVKFLIRMIDKELAAGLISFGEVEHELIRSFVNFPHCIDYALTIVASHSAMGEEIDREQWQLAINEELGRHIQSGHDHEICWLLTTAYICGLKLSIGASLSAIGNPLNACILYLLAENKQIDADLNEVFLASLNDRQSPADWILALEGINRGWFKRNSLNFEPLAGLEKLLPSTLTFLKDDIVKEFSSIEKGQSAIPDRYKRYDEMDDEGYIAYLIRQRMEDDTIPL
jgi:hypothetical protein